MRVVLSAALLAAIAACAVPAPAMAQQLWLEQRGGDAQLYYGEFADNRRETSPGALDELGRPEARIVSLEGRDVLRPKKLRDRFDLGGRITTGQALVVQDSRVPLAEVKQGDQVVRTIFIPAARYVTDLRAQELSLALDVFPTVRAGVFKVVFSGEPMVRKKIQVISASGWLRELTTDERGLVSVEFPWKSTYVIKVEHTDTRPGQRPTDNGPEKYDVARFVTTLTYEQSVGMPPLPNASR